jgi:hypothetical protein
MSSPDFDWAFNPKLPRAQLLELATARFVDEHSNVLLIGPPEWENRTPPSPGTRVFAEGVATLPLPQIITYHDPRQEGCGSRRT